MSVSREMAKFEKQYPLIGKPLNSIVKYAGSKSAVNLVRMVLLPAIMLGNYFGVIDFVPWARVILAVWVCVTLGAVSTLFAIRRRVIESYNAGSLKGDITVQTQKYGEPDRVDVFTLLEYDLEELQKLLNAAMVLASVTVGIYCYSANVTALVVQLVVIPVQLHGSALYQVITLTFTIYMAGEQAIGPYARPFQQMSGGNMMGEWMKVQKANWKVEKKGGRKNR